MGAYTASVAGNWSNPATWGGSGPPGSGDTATINANVTMDTDVTLGTSPNNGTIASGASCQLVLGTGNLTIAAGKTLTMKGNIWLANAILTMGAGSTINFDNSGSGGSPVYKLASWGIPKLYMTGASGNYSTITAISGQSWGLNDTGNNRVAFSDLIASYAKFQRLGNSGLVTGFQPYDTSSTVFSRCLFDSCGTTLFYNLTKPDVTITVDDCIWQNGSYGSNGAVQLQFGTTATSGTRRFKGNVLDDGLTYLSKGVRVVGNVIQGFGVGGALSSTDYNMLEFRGNFMMSNNVANSGNGCPLPGPVYRNYFVNNRAIGNPHFTAGTAFGVDTPFEQNVFENQSNDLIDTGDCIILFTGCATGGAASLIRNNICVPAKDGQMTGQLLTIYANDTVKAQCSRNTVNVNDTTIVGIGKRAAFAVSEASDGAADQVPLLNSNIVYGSSGSQGYVAERVRTTGVQNVITASGADKNWVFNTSAGDNLRGYNDKDGSGNMWSTGNAVGAGVDANQVSGDPAFYAGTRNAAAWATARGYGSTFADALAAVVAAPSRINDLISFVFEGFRPTTAGCRTASYDGMCVGAANWCNTARVSSHVTAWEATLTTFGITA